MAFSSDSLFHTLPAALQGKIDDAFTTTARAYLPSSSFLPAPPSPTGAGGFVIADSAPSTSDFSGGGGFIVEEPIPSTSTSGFSGGGGFIFDEPSGGGGGGFVVEDSPAPIPAPAPASPSQPSQIPLSLIPSALQLLDLPPDDPEVLAVFQNAAGGWRSSNVHPEHEQDKEAAAEEGEWVRREDWRAVCAVLMEGDEEHENGQEGEANANANEENEDEDVEMSDAYAEPDAASSLSDISSPEASDSDEYQQSPARRKPLRRTRGPPSTTVAGASSPTSSGTRAKPTPRQRKTALEAFALFFPELDENESLAAQRIRVTEIQRAAGVLREKIKAEEMVEMLAMFSTAPDKSMGLEDFTRMMIAAKLA